MKNIENQVQDILKNNGLDFRIQKVPMFAQLPDSTHLVENEEEMYYTNKVDTSYFGLYNDKSGNIINTCKAGYTVSQNDELVEMILRGIEPFGGKLKVNKAGALNDGRKVYIQLEIEGVARVGKDTIKKNITIIDSNDGSTGLSVGIGDFTMSCSNQFFYFNKKNEMKFRHTATIEQKIKTIPNLIKTALHDSMEMINLYNNLRSTKVSKDLADKLVNHLLGVDKTASMEVLTEMKTRSTNAMNSLYENIEKEMSDKENNLWGLFSGVTRWTTHEKASPRRENGRLESIMVGTNYKTNQQALEFVTEML